MSPGSAGNDHLAVPIWKGGTALIERADYEGMKALGAAGGWQLRHKRVCYMHPYWRRVTVQIARIMLGCQFAESVRYLDRNPLNLCRWNLRRIESENAYTYPLDELIKELPNRVESRLIEQPEANAIRIFLSRIPPR